jgi:hypothetical protein
VSSTATQPRSASNTADPTVCRLGIAEVFDVQSSSVAGKTYRVSLNPDRCNCRYRGECQHIRRARAQSQGSIPHTSGLAEGTAVAFLNEWAEGEEQNSTMAVLPREVAVKMLLARGWRPGPRGGWLSPSGRQYWVIWECIEIAFVAEVADQLR